jgi:hypothetical protein
VPPAAKNCDHRELAPELGAFDKADRCFGAGRSTQTPGHAEDVGRSSLCLALAAGSQPPKKTRHKPACITRENTSCSPHARPHIPFQ